MSCRGAYNLLSAIWRSIENNHNVLLLIVTAVAAVGAVIIGIRQNSINQELTTITNRQLELQEAEKTPILFAYLQNFKMSTDGKLNWTIVFSNQGNVPLHLIRYQVFIPSNPVHAVTPLRGIRGIIPVGTNMPMGEVEETLNKEVADAYHKFHMITLVTWFKRYPGDVQKCIKSSYMSSDTVLKLSSTPEEIPCPNIDGIFVLEI